MGGAVNHQSFLSSKLSIHLDVNDYVHIYVLIFRSNFSFSCLIRCNDVNFIKLYMDICHFFYNCLGPKVSPRFPVDIICFFYCLEVLYSKLM